jgi:hypothetical protein
MVKMITQNDFGNMKIFELIYARIYFTYLKYGESIHGLYATTLTSIIIGFNLLTLFILFNSFVLDTRFFEMQYSFVVVGAVSLIFTIIYFHSSGREKKIISNGSKFSSKENLAVRTYIFISVASFVLLLILKKTEIL